jgi:hypothetical protein
VYDILPSSKDEVFVSCDPSPEVTPEVEGKGSDAEAEVSHFNAPVGTFVAEGG